MRRYEDCVAILSSYPSFLCPLHPRTCCISAFPQWENILSQGCSSSRTVKYFISLDLLHSTSSLSIVLWLTLRNALEIFVISPTPWYAIIHLPTFIFCNEWQTSQRTLHFYLEANTIRGKIHWARRIRTFFPLILYSSMSPFISSIILPTQCWHHCCLPAVAHNKGTT